MAGRWVTIKGRHVYIDDQGFLRPGGPDASSKAHWNTTKHQWRRTHVMRWGPDKGTEMATDVERRSPPRGTGMGRKSETSERSWTPLSPAEREQKYWREHSVATAEQQKELHSTKRRNEEIGAYKNNLGRAYREWRNELESTIEQAAAISQAVGGLGSLRSAVHGGLEGVGKYLGRRAAGAGGEVIGGAAGKKAGEHLTKTFSRGGTPAGSGKADFSELDRAKAAAEAAIKRAQDAVERATRATDAASAKAVAEQAVRNARAATSRYGRVASSHGAGDSAEAVRRISQPGSLRVAGEKMGTKTTNLGPPMSSAEIDKQAKQGRRTGRSVRPRRPA